MKAQIDALAKYRNQLLSAFNAQQLAEMKRSNWSGLLEQTDALYATMYHDWDVLQKDSNDLAEAVQTLEWTVAPYVADGEEATPEAQAVAKVVTDALWKRTPQGLGTYSHTFTQLIGSLVHGLFRGFNVHEIEWKNDGNMVYPACFHQLPAQYMRWEDRAGHPDKLLFIADGETAEAKPFPAYKYIVGLNTSGPDHPIYNATYYSLVAWFGAFKFGLGWFMEYCQKYGIPKLVFHYESPNDRKQLEKDLSEERVLNNILLKGDRTVDIANAPASGASLPQRELLNLAESACHKLILGQTLTSDTSEHGGSLAQAKVHAGVQADIVKKRADFVADVLNTQLIPAIVLLNYGKLDVPMPELRFKIPQEGVTLERVQVVKTALEIKGMKLKKSEVYEFTGFAQPADGDDVFEAASEGADMAGLAGLMGKGKPQDDTDPDDDPNKPKKKAAKSESDAEPVSAAKADAPTDPAQEWLAPIKQKFLEARKAGASMADMRKMLLTMHPNTKALAKAFANNILAGFAGESEEVDAANPYGCNQYGEGWRMPHNGRASKVGAPVKKTDPTEEERRQKEEEERKRQEEEQQRKEEEERKAREEEKDKEKFNPANSIKEAEEFAKSLGIPNVNYKGLDLEVVNTLNERLQETIREFPETLQYLNYVGSAQGRKSIQEPIVRKHFEEKLAHLKNYGEDYFQECVNKKVNKYFKAEGEMFCFNHKEIFGDDSMAGLCVNANRYNSKNIEKTKRILEYQPKAKHWPVECGSVKSVVDHELGHILDYTYKISSDPTFLYNKQHGLEGVGRVSGENLSRYALTNNKETVAEAWTEYKNNPKPRKWAQFVGGIIEKQKK